MDHVLWRERPDLNDPVLVLAFDGWNDAGDAATTALDYLALRHDHRTIATVDPEIFFDFGSARPSIRLNDGRTRSLEWPTVSFGWFRLDNGRDIITLRGPEPRLRWRTFHEQITGVASELGVEMAISLGALLAEVHHATDTSVFGTSTDTDLIARHGLRMSSYQGPTGIVGVLQYAFTKAQIPAMSLWASVPTYVPSSTSPKAAYALLMKLTAMFDIALEANDLRIAATTYERQVDELLDDDDDLAEYAQQILLASVDDDDVDDADPHPDDILPALDESDGDNLIEDLEQFLRDQN